MIPYNHEIAEKLREMADLLVEQRANPFRSRAYLNAATTLDNLSQDIRTLLSNKGINALIELPAIGSGIARSIQDYAVLGRMPRLESLQGGSDPVKLFQSIPTVGRELAQRIHDTLHVDTYESLENAAHNGLLDQVQGLGSKRKEAIKSWLITHLGERRQQARLTPHAQHEPPIKLLLKIDTQYLTKAAAGKLPSITPKRFNPDNIPWLPILHMTRESWHFTAMFSNTERAHKLNRLNDWVIIYFYDDLHQEGQCTVVTETHGDLVRKRVIRGREQECRKHYQSVDNC